MFLYATSAKEKLVQREQCRVEGGGGRKERKFKSQGRVPRGRPKNPYMWGGKSNMFSPRYF